MASLLFFVSGGTGLAYQVVWFKRFTHVWGSSSLAFAAVGGSFLFGLGLGAYLFGRYADRVGVPLRWYGLCELAIGALALVIPFEIAALVDASVGLYARIPEQPLLRFFVQFCITLLVIGPSCLLMGGTLPLLIRQLTTRKGSLDEATGWLYAINTFGAATGCYLTGFHLLPALGLLWTNNLAAAVNVTIGAVALLVSRTLEQRLPARDRSPALAEVAAPVPWSWSLARLYLATAMAGCAALVLEMTWTRQLVLVLGGSTYAFTATLFVVLVGIALGSLIFHIWLRSRASSPGLPLVVIGILIATTLVGKWLLPWLSLSVAPDNVRELRGDAFWNGVICVGASSVLELIPAVAMGILFPLFVHLTHASAVRVGAAVGNIYAWNTLGSIAGASLTALLLFPSIGTTGAMALALTLYLLALLAVLSWSTRAEWLRGAAATLLGAVAIVVIAQPIDPRLTNFGLYIYGDQVHAANNSETHADWISLIKPLYFQEGASSNVFVTGTSGHSIGLRVNGKADASNGADMANQLGLAYFPRMFKPDAKEVLVIGFGSGCTPGAALMFPGTQVTCCEIEPATYAASDQFAMVNHRPQEKTRSWLEARNATLPPEKRLTPDQISAEARLQMIFGDGRTAIQGSDKKYDIIISEPSNPWLAGVSNLFTQEYFRTAREHLTEGGVLAQWIQAYNFTASDYLMIVRTLRTEFPHFGTLVFSGGADTVLLASNKPLLPEAAQIEELQALVNENPEITNDFKTWFGGTELRYLLMEYYQLGEDQLNRLVDANKSQDLNTDLHLRLEFDAPLHLFRKLQPSEMAMSVLQVSATSTWADQLGAAVGVQRNSLEYHLTSGDYLVNQAASPMLPAVMRASGLDRAAAHFKVALAIDSRHLQVRHRLAKVFLSQGKSADAEELYQQLVRATPTDPTAHAELALALVYQKRAEAAVAHFREALRLDPRVAVDTGTAMWANNLAWILATNPDDKLRNGPEAVQWATKACEAVEYKQSMFLDTLSTALAEVGSFDEAVKTCEQILAMADDQPKLVETTKSRIKLYQSSQPYRDQ